MFIGILGVLDHGCGGVGSCLFVSFFISLPVCLFVCLFVSIGFVHVVGLSLFYCVLVSVSGVVLLLLSLISVLSYKWTEISHIESNRILISIYLSNMAIHLRFEAEAAAAAQALYS